MWTTECDDKLEAKNSERCVDHEIHLLTLVGEQGRLKFDDQLNAAFLLSHTKQRYKYNTCRQYNAGAHALHTKLPVLIKKGTYLTTTLWALHISDKQHDPWTDVEEITVVSM